MAMGFAADDAYANAALNKFDKDGDGTLSAAEFGPLFEFLNRQAAAAAAAVQADSTVSLQYECSAATKFLRVSRYLRLGFSLDYEDGPI